LDAYPQGDVGSEGAAGDDLDACPAQKALWHRREALLDKHPTGTVYVAWDNSNTHEDEEVEVVLRAAAGRLVLLYLPTYSPWLNPIEMLWRHFRREVTHCELFPNVKALIAAAYAFFERYNRCPWQVLSIIGSDPAEIT
jgi:transposase